MGYRYFIEIFFINFFIAFSVVYVYSSIVILQMEGFVQKKKICFNFQFSMIYIVDIFFQKIILRQYSLPENLHYSIDI